MPQPGKLNCNGSQRQSLALLLQPGTAFVRYRTQSTAWLLIRLLFLQLFLLLGLLLLLLLGTGRIPVLLHPLLHAGHDISSRLQLLQC
jgi:hypothetical protein